MSEVYKYNGLRRRPNFDELITYIQKDKPTSTLHTRSASILADTHQMNALQGDTLTDLERFGGTVRKRKIRTYINSRIRI